MDVISMSLDYLSTTTLEHSMATTQWWTEERH
jgi:hypothetical protein